MKQTYRLTLLTLSLGLLSACSTTTRQAPIIDRAAPPAERAHPAAGPSVEESSKEDAHGMYTVRKGDTLIRIALDHGQNYRDLATWNNLANPDDIKVDQVLRVIPPERVAGVQTQAVTPPATEVRAPAPPPPPKKTLPRGDKKPYSEANLAELQKADKPDAAKPAELSAAPPPPAAPAAPPPAPAPLVTPPAPLGEDEKLSWIWPSDGRIIGTFDEGKNKGIDIAGKAGQQVLAAGSGKVIYAGSGIRGYGNLIIVRHNINVNSVYAHNRAIVVKEGQAVTKGQLIAEMGDSDTEPATVKLHFEIRQQGKPVDPSKFLPTR